MVPNSEIDDERQAFAERLNVALDAAGIDR
jgi:hypothetical protein